MCQLFLDVDPLLLGLDYRWWRRPGALTSRWLWCARCWDHCRNPCSKIESLCCSRCATRPEPLSGAKDVVPRAAVSFEMRTKLGRRSVGERKSKRGRRCVVLENGTKVDVVSALFRGDQATVGAKARLPNACMRIATLSNINTCTYQELVVAAP